MHSGKRTPYDFIDIRTIERRSFLKTVSLLGIAGLTGSIKTSDDFPEETSKFIREARYYEKLPHKKIRCNLCPRACEIDERERGYCGVRENREGTYYTLVYARPCTYHADPIEKKPLFHFLPGTLAFSIATAGCNVNCKFCQNWQISQVRPEQIRSIHMPPDKTALLAKEYQCRSIAYTYSEPIIFYEYMEDCIYAGHDNNIRSVMITGGYISQKPLQNLCTHIDGIKVDLKSYSEKYYREVVNGELKPVLDALITMKKMGVWTEIVYLVVPTLNDSDREFTDLCRWIKTNLGIDVPIHFTRFHPQYLLKNLPPTPVPTLEKAKSIADTEGLQYVYIGNVPGHKAENTLCHKCGKVLIDRIGYTIRQINITKGKCDFCQATIPGVWE
jgi:pyruvate formate lyase activating enzyme